MGLRLLAALWGLAEATLFFIVPDVLLSAVALRDRRQALRLCLWALVGALAGGALMYVWGSRAPDEVWAALVGVPAVSEAMVAGVAESLREAGALTTFLGPLSGTPYKLYAALAPGAGINLGLFLLVSLPARLVRFVLITLLAAWVARSFLSRWSFRQRLALHLSAWTTFYGCFLLLMPW
jgi:membrane protein YqaA with SNARE-associated domain